MDCTICLEPFKKPAALTCGHVFCQACLIGIPRGGIYGNYGIPCPTCRLITSGGPINLYGIESEEAQSAGAVEEATESFKICIKKAQHEMEKTFENLLKVNGDIRGMQEEKESLRQQIKDLKSDKKGVLEKFRKEALHNIESERDKMKEEAEMLKKEQDSIKFDIRDLRIAEGFYCRLSRDIRMAEKTCQESRKEVDKLSKQINNLKSHKKKVIEELKLEAGQEAFREYRAFTEASEKVFKGVNTPENFIKIMELIKALKDSAEEGRIKGVDLGTQKLIEVLLDV